MHSSMISGSVTVADIKSVRASQGLSLKESKERLENTVIQMALANIKENCKDPHTLLLADIVDVLFRRRNA